ncbi:MAG: hypothetical protein IJU31_05105 [Synergistaceae bacterium]|nr:hypothetical protein [Synergistaceae bacterium]
MSKIIFSIPVHEKPEVVFDQVCNIQHFNPGCGIVLHISPVFSWDKSKITRSEFESRLREFPDVFVNPEQVRTGWFDIIQAHVSNYKCVRGKVGFDYFVLCASNELYIKTGAEEFVEGYEAGFSFKPVDFKHNIGYVERASRDEPLLNIIKHITNYANKNEILRCIYHCQVEGDFFSVKVFDEIFALMEKYFDHNAIKYLYQREEIYFGTITKLTTPEEKIWNKPLTFFTYNAHGRDTINSLISNENKFFSVKRVDRDINNPLRAYIRDVVGGYHDEVARLCQMELKPFDEKELEIYETQRKKQDEKEISIRRIKNTLRRIKPLRLFLDRNRFIVSK